jgi:hypothetical protein
VNHILIYSDALLDAKVGSKVWLVEGLMPEVGITLIQGNPGAGKSWLTLELMRCLGVGERFLGRATKRAEGVALLFDAPLEDYRGQWVKLCRGRSRPNLKFVRDSDLDLSNPESVKGFIDWCESLRREQPAIGKMQALEYYFNDGRFDSALWAEHKAATRETGVDFVVLDSLSNMHSANENHKETMGPVMDALRLISTKLACAVIISHHLSKPTEGRRSNLVASRGSTVIPAKSDMVLHVGRNKSGSRHLGEEKVRGIEHGGINFDLVIDEEEARIIPGKPDPTVLERALDVQTAMQLAHQGDGTVSRKQLKALGWDDNRAKTALNRLERDYGYTNRGGGVYGLGSKAETAPENGSAGVQQPPDGPVGLKKKRKDAGWTGVGR